MQEKNYLSIEVVHFLIFQKKITIFNFFSFSGESFFSTQYQRRFRERPEKLLGNPEMREHFLRHFGHRSVSRSQGERLRDSVVGKVPSITYRR